MLKKIKWSKPCLFVGTISTPEGLRLLAQPQPNTDLIEIRYDALYHAGVSAEHLITHLAKRKNRVLLTLRTTREGGLHPWKSTERVNLFMQLIPHVDAIDLEVQNLNLVGDVLQEARNQNKGVILSAHAISRKVTYGRALRWLENLREYRVQAYKMASLARTKEDLGVLVRILLDHPKVRLGIMAMGPQSDVSRLVLPSLGSKLVYGYLDAPVVKGQPAIKDVAAALPWLVA
jgi:3-dehydroquinate dehydratase type I